MFKLIKTHPLIYLLFLTPFFVIPGIAIVELSVIIITLIFLLKNRNLEYYKDIKFLFLLLYSIYVATNAFFQIDDDLKFSSFFFFRYVLFSLSIFFILDLYKNIPNFSKKKILFFYLVICFFIFFDSYLQFFTGKNLFGFEIIRATVSSIFGSELILGSFLLKLLPITLFLFFYSNINIKDNSLLLIIFLSLFFSVVFIAGGRTPFFLMLLFILFIIFFIRDLRFIFNLSTLLLVLFIISTLIFEFGKSKPGNRMFIKTFDQMTNYIFTKTENQIVEEKNDINKKEIIKNIKVFSSNHNGHYILAYDLFKKNPIFGIGPKGFRHYCRGVDYDPPIGICSTHPHNFLIQILSETGLLGFLFYIFGIIFVVVKLFQAYIRKEDNIEKNYFLVISIGLIINFFPFVPNGNFFNNWISITSFYYIGIYLYSYKRLFYNL